MDPMNLVNIVCIMGFTAVSAFMDLRERRIPNKLTGLFFVTGLLFQIVIAFQFGPRSLLSPLLASVISLLILGGMWIAGGVGAGDAKLMAGLGMWLGLQNTLYVMLGSLLMSLILLVSLQILRKMRIRTGVLLVPVRTPGKATGTKVHKGIKLKRGIPYAVGVCLSTWAFVAFRAILPALAN
jgi:prepilin peptidase CpaA